ncbi:hypothetical protein K435DRAFT_816816 [Dendrothele bispora CBS 962.96]|uniref:GST N-terminal domain-containing protein n=1 Tax=Dendrothele bispora (strain CBS 962.96) TaxID=1314807 RepID=A0A4S8MRJ4_DENBC|nr:hypothetical protein K435DRAFT_816816 [Dendrothele bispora CBS 962.96]
MSTSKAPKAILYYYPLSVWSSAALLTLEEKGYGDNDVDLKIVDLSKGENYDPAFLRLNPKAKVPTLIVPLQKTLSEEVESRYKAITDTKTLIEFLDKSRSPLSRTNTTSDAPAPTLTPATIAFLATSKTIVDDILHSEAADPNNLTYVNARDEASLHLLAESLIPFFKGRQKALNGYLADPEIRVTEKVKNFWKTRKEATEALLAVYEKAETPGNQLSEDDKKRRQEFFETAKSTWEVGLSKLLLKLNAEIIGPYSLGEQYSIADPHLAAWLTRVVLLAGGSPEEDGNTVIGKLESHVGNGLAIPKTTRAVGEETVSKSKLAEFWDVVKERNSWQKVYSNGLH